MSVLENGLDFVGLCFVILLRPICFSLFSNSSNDRRPMVYRLEGSAHLSYDPPLEKLRNQPRSLEVGFFCSLNWAVIAQNEILSPHSQMTYSVPIA